MKRWLWIVGSALFLWLWIFGNQGLYELQKLIHIRQDLQDNRATLEKEKENLKGELKALEGSSYLDHLVRQELGYVKPNEKIVQFQEPPAEGPPAEAPTSQ